MNKFVTVRLVKDFDTITILRVVRTGVLLLGYTLYKVIGLSIATSLGYAFSSFMWNNPVSAIKVLYVS